MFVKAVTRTDNQAWKIDINKPYPWQDYCLPKSITPRIAGVRQLFPFAHRSRGEGQVSPTLFRQAIQCHCAVTMFVITLVQKELGYLYIATTLTLSIRVASEYIKSPRAR